MKKMNEGLYKNDLQDLVLPLISIDEYESKIGSYDSIIVVGFYVMAANMEDAPTDLSRFIDRTTEIILDTDVSPAPDESGYFMVFTEIPRDKNFVDTLLAILLEIKPLVDIPLNGWTFKTPFNRTKPIELSKKSLEKFIRADPNTLKEDHDISMFLYDSVLRSLDVKDGKVLLNGTSYDVVSFGKGDEILKEAVSFDVKDTFTGIRIHQMLGENYSVYMIGGKRIVINSRLHEEKLVIK